VQQKIDDTPRNTIIPVIHFFQNSERTTKDHRSPIDGMNTAPTEKFEDVHIPINVTIVTIRSLIFDVGRVDGNLPCLLFGGAVNVLVGHGLRPPLLAKDFRNGLRQRRLTVIDVADRPNVHMWLRSIEVHGKAPSRKVKDVTTAGGALGGKGCRPWKERRRRLGG
jgi:hypothetical protein